MLPELIDLAGQKQFRIIPSCYPPINFFEDLVDASEMAVLWEIESLTNERLREEVGELFLVPEVDRVSGPGSSVVMAAFTHISAERATRFSDGSFGVYYAGLAEETAIRETVYHRERFLLATNEDACELAMRLCEGEVIKPLYDIRGERFARFHQPNNYSESQQFGKKVKKLQSWGMIYRSVRHVGGNCVAILRPPAVSVPKPIRHLKYIWNGKKIIEVVDLKCLVTF